MQKNYGRASRPMSLVCSTGRMLLVLLALVLSAATAYGQGKIAGRVTDADTGEPLPGVNVVIDDTQQGTSTNADGDYVIVNVRPGEYTLVFSFIGFQTKRITGVQVATGQTTRIDAELSEQVVQGEEVIVRAERPLVQKDLTASRKTVVAEEIEALPVEGFFGVLSTQAGITQGADGELHIRGGRSNEIAYLVDGLSVGNPFETNGLATAVAKDAIQELTVVSGAFNAEYGKAMSGIVNLVTKEGGENYEGSFSAYGGDNVTARDETFMTPSGLDLNNYTLEGTLSGPVPLLPNVRFFVSGRRDVDDGHIFGRREHLPSDSAKFTGSQQEIDERLAEIRRYLPDYDPATDGTPWYYELHGVPWYQIAADPALADSIAAVSELVPMNPRSSYNLLTKFTVRPFSGAKLNYSFLADGGKRKPFAGFLNTFAYRFNPDGTYTDREQSYNHSLHWTHTLNDRTFYEFKGSYATNSFERYVYEKPQDPRYVKDLGPTGEGRVVGRPGNNFFFGGNQKEHIYEDSESWRFKLDFTRQFGVIHETKTGVDVQLHWLDRQNFVVLYDGDRYPRPTVLGENTPVHDRYEGQFVREVSAYLQDKLEYEDFIINVGLRYEHFDPHGRYIPDLLNLDRYVEVDQADQDELLERPKADPVNLLLPRLGVSFPITERGIIHFSYGHFAQMPPLRDLYRNPEFEFAPNTVPTFGNTNLRPERTVQYEVGLQQQLGDVLAFDITGYFKDVRDYLAPQRIRYSDISGQNEYIIYQNRDYANIKGLTFSLTKRRAPNGLLSATIAYTYQVAEGNNNDPNAFFYNFLSGREQPFEVIPLDFDQRHVLSSTVTVSRPGDWGISLIGQYATGYPYSPVLFDQNLDLLPNSDRKPAQIQLDANIFKEFDVGPVSLRAFARIYNVLDRMNERFVFDDTGRATYSLNVGDPHSAWRAYYGRPGIHDLEEYNTRPHWFSPPRQINLGLTLSF